MIARATPFETTIKYADAPLVRRESLAWWERAPGQITEQRMGETTRQVREASWRMRHQATFSARCGDVWDAVLGETHCLI